MGNRPISLSSSDIVCGVLRIAIGLKFGESYLHKGRRERLDVRTKRGVRMKSRVDMLTKTDSTPGSSDEAESGLAAAAEYWAGRAMWALVIIMSLWDIAVTFDSPATLMARLF
jgi:hypothetical protein